ncbi:MAG: hypothetical protein GX361_04260 [Bacteroidales bacterium]|nr:hypothetical protein [Bacteroidales bacterium]
MSNHVHLIIRAAEGFLLQNILRDFKRFTSKTIVEAIKENPQESRKGWLLDKFSTLNTASYFFQPSYCEQLTVCFTCSQRHQSDGCNTDLEQSRTSNVTHFPV